MDKYKLTNRFQPKRGKKLFQIVALRSFSDVRCGDVGGFIEHEENLSQNGECWVYPGAIACEFSRISENAILKNHSITTGYSRVFGNAQILGNAIIRGNAFVYDDSIITGWSVVGGESSVFGYSNVDCKSSKHKKRQLHISDQSMIINATIRGCPNIKDHAIVFGNIFGHSKIFGESYIDSYSVVRNATVENGVVVRSVIGPKTKFQGMIRDQQ